MFRAMRSTKLAQDLVGWDLSNGTCVNEITTTDFDSNYTRPDSIALSADRTRLYVGFRTLGRIVQFNLAAAGDITTATDSGKYLNVAGGMWDIYFKPDGTKLYVAGADNDWVYQYNLGAAWDLATASQYDTLDFPDTNQISGITLSNDGLLMYTSLYTITEVYNLSSAWDLKTASLSYTMSSDNISDLRFKPDGLTVYELASGIKARYLTVPWNVQSGVTLDPTIYKPCSSVSYGGLWFDADGYNVYVSYNNGSTITHISLI